MSSFTDWDIVRNLLLAARWTLLLSLIAFTCGTLVTLPLLALRIARWRWPKLRPRQRDASHCPFGSARMLPNQISSRKALV